MTLRQAQGRAAEKRRLYRILDANLNRSREALRTAEDIARFVFENRALARELKGLRHAVRALFARIPLGLLLAERGVRSDPGRAFDALEKKRRGWTDLYFANIQRAKESLRVLEETSKLLDPRLASAFKKMRFRVYEHEKKAFEKLASVRCS